MSLGIFQRLFTLLENECYELDQEIIINKEQISSTTTSNFLQYQLAREKLLDLQEELDRVNCITERAQQMLVFLLLTITEDPSNNSRVQSVSNLVQVNTKRLADIVSILNIINYKAELLNNILVMIVENPY